MAAALVLLLGAGCNSGAQYSGRLFYADGNELIELNLRDAQKRTALRLEAVDRGTRLRRTHYDVSRDCRYIAYVETRGGLGDKLPPRRSLVVLDRSREKTIFRMALPEPVLFPVTLSPEGKLLALICDSSSLSGTPMLRVVRLSDGKTVLSPVTAYNDAATWSPDSNSIGFADQWVRPVVMHLPDMKRDVLPGRGSPKWSPDGKYIAIDRTLWSVRERRTVKKLALPEGMSVDGWTPDSRSVVYTYEDAFKSYPLCVCAISSGKISKVVPNHGGSDTYPTVWRR